MSIPAKLAKLAKGMPAVYAAGYLEGLNQSGAVLYGEQDLTDEQKAQARKNIGAGDQEAVRQLYTETSDIWDNINAVLVDMDSFVVRGDRQQDFAEKDQKQARANIGAASEEFLKTITVEVSTLSQDFWQLSENASVRYDAEQTLTDEQKAQALENIGAITSEDVGEITKMLVAAITNIADNQAVRYDTEQTLTDTQKAKARANIGALTESEMKAYVEESILGGEW